MKPGADFCYSNIFVKCERDGRDANILLCFHVIMNHWHCMRLNMGMDHAHV